jgi:dipeptidyl aminopeptidase/acylaminoacyl peptidase
MKGVVISVLIPLFALMFFTATSQSLETKKPFTVADEISLINFGHPNAERTAAIQFSPDGNYLLVVTERGRLDLNRIEDSLRFYRSVDIKAFLKNSDKTKSPTPLWVATLLTEKEIESDWRWLDDSSSVALLEPTVSGHKQLLLVDLKKKRVEPLTSPNEDTVDFDVRNPNHYVYAQLAPVSDKARGERHQPAIVGTGRSLWELIFPDNPRIREEIAPAARSLWAVVNGKRFQIKHQGQPIVPEGELALSPDGHFLVTKMIVPEVPQSWGSSFHVDSGHGSSVHQYVLIDLQTGSTRALTNTPISDDARAVVPQGEWALTPAVPRWSNDGEAILLPGTFVRTGQNVLPRPCVAVFDLPSNDSTCVEALKKRHSDTGGREEGFHYVMDVRFSDGNKQRVVVSYDKTLYGEIGSTEYRHATDGTWRIETESQGTPAAARNGLEVRVKQGLDEPPVLFAATSRASGVLWDPNPQLKRLDLGQASLYTWKDTKGRQWNAGLYKPSNWKSGVRYPLVIQTHGFVESQFLPSGLYPTAFAARELAAAGIIVLQVAEHSTDLGLSPEDAPTAVANYKAIVDQLVSEGLVDPEKVGIIGFSHTCFYVMQALTTRTLRLKAASITEGEMGGYFQYLQQTDRVMKQLYDAEIGAAPFGEGLRQWLKESPGFKLDKVDAPLMVVGNDPLSVLLMWEPYVGLRVLHKPVDLIMLHAYEHVLTNPAVRLASQGGSVDWFRFWLQGYEDSDPAKAEQYTRWRELRSMQADSEKKSAAASPRDGGLKGRPTWRIKNVLPEHQDWQVLRQKHLLTPPSPDTQAWAP